MTALAAAIAEVDHKDVAASMVEVAAAETEADDDSKK
jgi:hypothetical protein